ncbi:MAG: ATP-binding protein [Deltaproteobacteria bacterium]|nr:ATP-binding protein [Deltaproteobacteria bacterium]
MPRWFNTAGPCKAELHYMLTAERRIPDVRQLVEEQAYFVVHAPRQVGKTTSLLSLAQHLTVEGRFAAVLLSAEVGAPFGNDAGKAERAIVSSWRMSAEHWLPPELQPPAPSSDPVDGAHVKAMLSSWARACPRPLVVFIDEIDALYGEALLSLLRQLRDGYSTRPRSFPWSLALVGLRDVRDYKVAAAGEGRLVTSSPFNIKVESLTLRDFTRDEVAELYGQHTADTGQAFETAAVDRAFELTRGQPWLVNAMARQLVNVVVPGASRPIAPADVDSAKGILIARQDTHLDSLTERLREPRVRRLIEPILAGTTLPDVPTDDVRYVCDLGLVRQRSDGGLEIANPIYAEVIPTSLAVVTRASLPEIAPTWLRPHGRLDAQALLDALLAFWRRHGEPLLGSAPYHEIAPHLVLMAFLHRVANGGGALEREYAIGRGRMDLCLRYGPDVLAIELKVWRDGEPDPKDEGLDQLDGYLAGLGLDAGWLVIFDRRAGVPRISERTAAAHEKTPSGRAVVVVRA